MTTAPPQVVLFTKNEAIATVRSGLNGKTSQHINQRIAPSLQRHAVQIERFVMKTMIKIIWCVLVLAVSASATNNTVRAGGDSSTCQRGRRGRYLHGRCADVQRNTKS